MKKLLTPHGGFCYNVTKKAWTCWIVSRSRLLTPQYLRAFAQILFAVEYDLLVIVSMSGTQHVGSLYMAYMAFKFRCKGTALFLYLQTILKKDANFFFSLALRIRYTRAQLLRATMRTRFLCAKTRTHMRTRIGFQAKIFGLFANFLYRIGIYRAVIEPLSRLLKAFFIVIVQYLQFKYLRHPGTTNRLFVFISNSTQLHADFPCLILLPLV